MTIPSSRFLQRLDAAMAASSSAVQADCLRAEQACYLARQGHFEHARPILDALRARYDKCPLFETSIWLNLAEAMMALYGGDPASALDRFRRAHALSIAGDLSALRALSAAWLAHMAYLRRDIPLIGRYVREAFHHSDQTHHSTRSRACLVVAMLFHLADRRTSAAEFYAKTKTHANAEGDEVTINILLYTKAVQNISQLRRLVLTGKSDTISPKFALPSLESALNFDKLVRSQNLSAYIPLLRAQAHAYHNEFEEALALFDPYTSAERQKEDPARLESYCLSEMAWCQANMGLHDQALDSAECALQRLSGDVHIDERASTHSRLAMVYGHLSLKNQASDQSRLAAAAWQAHERLQQEVLVTLTTLFDNVVC